MMDYRNRKGYFQRGNSIRPLQTSIREEGYEYLITIEDENSDIAIIDQYDPYTNIWLQARVRTGLAEAISRVRLNELGGMSSEEAVKPLYELGRKLRGMIKAGEVVFSETCSRCGVVYKLQRQLPSPPEHSIAIMIK